MRYATTTITLTVQIATIEDVTDITTLGQIVAKKLVDAAYRAGEEWGTDEPSRAIGIKWTTDTTQGSA